MTSAIKPPGRGSPTDAAAGPDATPEAGRGERFADVVGAGAGARTEQTGAATDLAEALRAGEIDPAEAVERLLADALASPMAQQLDAQGRAALEAHLRATLADDPSLSALVRDLEAAR